MFVRVLVITAVLAGFAHCSCPYACKWKIRQLKKRVDKFETEPPAPPTGAGPGHVYTRWGRTTCRVNSVLLYEGFVAGAYYSQNGGGANTLCLPKKPEFATVQPGVKGCGGYIYGAEYESCSKNNIFDTKNLHTDTPQDQDMPCAVCQATKRQSHVMIPAKINCPTGWQKEYQGYIMGSHYSYRRAEWICVDSAPEARDHGAHNKNGALFYQAEIRCGVVPCPPYTDGHELACVVCTQ